MNCIGLKILTDSTKINMILSHQTQIWHDIEMKWKKCLLKPFFITSALVLCSHFTIRANKSMSVFIFVSYRNAQMFSSAKQSVPCAYRGLNFPISTSHPPINQSWAFSSTELNCISKRTIWLVCIQVLVQVMRTAVFNSFVPQQQLELSVSPWGIPPSCWRTSATAFSVQINCLPTCAPTAYPVSARDSANAVSSEFKRRLVAFFFFFSSFHHHTSSPCHTFA